MAYENLSFPEAVEALAEILGMEVPRDAVHTEERRGEHDELYALLREADQIYRAALRDSPQAIALSEEARNRRPDGRPLLDGLRAGRMGHDLEGARALPTRGSHS